MHYAVRQIVQAGTLKREKHMSDAARPLSILVVSASAEDLLSTGSALRSAGYHVTEASEFHSARRWLENDPPDALITAIKLGAYNGLHLVVRAHGAHPNIACILTNDSPDPVLQAEAEKQHATYLTHPLRRSDLVDAVARALEFEVPLAVPGVEGQVPSLNAS